MTKRIAIAGLGAAARTIHLPAYAKLPELEVVGAYDPAPSTSQHPFPTFTSMEALLDGTKPDIVVVAAPTAAHFELTATALRAGCHVLCEKPFMIDLREADAIIALAASAERWVVVNNEYRFMNIHSAARNAIGSPEFGGLQFISMNQTFFRSDATEQGWRGQDLQRTAKEFGTHALDLCRFYFGEDPQSVSARMPKGDRPGGPDYLNLVQLEFSGDRVAHILLDRITRGRNRYLDARLDGTAGSIETSIGGTAEVRAGLDGRSRRPYLRFDVAMGGQARLYHGERYRKLATDPLDLFANATANLMRAFVAAIEDGSTPPCHAEDNRRTLALMLATYESSAQNAPVAMTY